MEKITVYQKPIKWVATMEVDVPDYSSKYYTNAVKAMKYELDTLDIKQVEPEYIYIIALETDRDDDEVELVISIGVEGKYSDTDSIKFVAIDGEEEILRIETDKFDNIHIGLAEWMHDNDYEVSGPLRRVLHDGEHYIYDCPIKKSES